MNQRWKQATACLAVGIVSILVSSLAFAQGFISHPPTRPMPAASLRPLATGAGRYVDPQRGDDRHQGTQDAPWRSLAHAVNQLGPGDVLYLRGGEYYEHVAINLQGTREQPIIIRGYPGEVAVIDGGLREFFESPDNAWEPLAGGGPGEFRSTNTFPDLGGNPDATNLLGNFGDSMIPLHGYRYLSDLRSANESFAKLNAGKTEAGGGVYCGPGLFYDLETGHIHIRLAHTRQKALGRDNYRGETDPRRIPLVIAGVQGGSPLVLEGARYVRVQDVVVRGSRAATVAVNNSYNIEFDGLTAYGGASAMSVRDSGGLRLWNCALRGIAAPWTYRGSLKYRAIEARIFSASGWAPTGADSHDFELAYSEFTDCVDGVFIGNVRDVRFHHNLLDNLSDDGIFLTATTAYDGSTPGGKHQIYQNLLSRCLTTFAFGVGHGRQKMTALGRQAGVNTFIFRNVFDFRRPVMYTQPAEEETKITSIGRISGDHGGPLWEPMTIYHNTIVQVEPPFRNYYLAGLGSHLAGGSRRRLFNNLVVQTNGTPGFVLPAVVPPRPPAPPATSKTGQSVDPLDALVDKPTKKRAAKSRPPGLPPADLAKLDEQAAVPAWPLPVDFLADGNLHWSYSAQSTAASLLGRFQESPAFAASKALYPPGWTAHDVVADPQLMQYQPDWQAPLRCGLNADSPAVNAGARIPRHWPDPLGKQDQGEPDIGAIPLGLKPWSVGVRGRIPIFGAATGDKRPVPAPSEFILDDSELPNAALADATRSALIIQGYPAFDAPLIEFALRRQRVPFESVQRTWVDPATYLQHGLVVVVGDLPRAKIVPNAYTAADLSQVERFLHQGGTLMLMRGNTSLFKTPECRKWLVDRTGTNRAAREPFGILADHQKDPWLRHLQSADPAPMQKWVNIGHAQPLRATRGDVLIGSRNGLATLYRLKVGQGQLIYVGWDIAASLPHGRKPSTVELEVSYEQQMQILTNIIESVTLKLRP